MIKMIAGASVLIVAVMVVRHLTKGRISMRLRYALWIMVVLRLIIPVNVGSSPLSVMNLQGAAESYAEQIKKDAHKETADVAGNAGWTEFADIAGVGQMENADDTGKQSGQETQEMGGTVSYETQVETGSGAEYTAGNGNDTSMQDISAAGVGVVQGLNQPDEERLETESSPFRQAVGEQNLSGDRHRFSAIVGVWLAGIVVIGGCMAVGQIRFIFCLHSTRKEVTLNELPAEWGIRLTERRVHVYTVQGLPGPCMAGRSIYINPELCSRNNELLHVLAHEYSHAVQGDNWWAFIRCMLCMVYWFHPLVWMAAYASKQDSELACDERAIGLLGETERFAYGRTLLELAFDGQNRRSYIGAVLMMNDSAKKVKERVSAIAETKKKKGVTAVVVGLIAVLMCGCVFTGAVQTDAGAVTETEEAQRKEETAMRAEAEEIEQMENAAIANRFAEMEKEKAQEEQKVSAMRTEAEEIEQEEIRKYLEELEAQAQVMQTALEAKTQEIQSMHTLGAEEKMIVELETKETAIRKELDEINQLMQEIKEEWQQATADEFGKLLYSMTDEALESAVPAESLDAAECTAYLYNGGQSPIEDGGWCRLYQDEEYGIEIYGLYTDMYGCRGMKMKIDGDVNTWDIIWRMPIHLPSVEVMMLEQTPEGLPRSFAFKVCTQNTSTSEVWRLYLADRYDTGTISLYAFDEEECKKQFRDTVGFILDEDENKVFVTYEKDVVVGAIDISEYAEYTVNRVIWDGSVVGYSMDHDGTIILKTCIGLKIAETGETLYRGLSIIDCPVKLGVFGEREFTLGMPSVE